jgi:cell division protein FtsX
MDIIYSTNISVSLFQIMALLTLTTVALLYGMARVALFINYVFILYWGYLSNFDKFYDSQFHSVNAYSGYYVIFGIVIILLATAALLVRAE